PTPDIPSVRSSSGSQQQLDAMTADRIVPTFEMVSTLFPDGVFPRHASSAVSMAWRIVLRQHEPDGFVISQAQPGSFILWRMSTRASDRPLVQSSSSIVAAEWPKQ